MIEALDLLAEDEVLEQSRAALSNAQAILISDGPTNIGGHEGIFVVQVELRQEFFSGGCSIPILTALDAVGIFA